MATRLALEVDWFHRIAQKNSAYNPKEHNNEKMSFVHRGRRCLNCRLGQEIKGKYTGTVLLAKINDSRVNVRDFPSLSATKVGQLNNGDLIAVTGVSENSDQIEGVSSHWLRVQLVTGSYEYGDPLGWVFGKYVEKGAVLQPALLRYGDFIPATDRKVALLRISFEVDGQKKEAVVRPKKIEGRTSIALPGMMMARTMSIERFLVLMRGSLAQMK